MTMNKKIDDDFNNFEFKDLGEIIEKLFGNISKLPNLGDINPKTHHHSITYRFGAGMDKPEIRLNGEEIDNETLNNFIGDLNPNTRIIPKKITLNSKNHTQELDIKNISISENPNPPIAQFEETYFEVEKDGETRIVTIELPSVEEDQIFISQSGDLVTIIGENEFMAFKVEFEMEFKFNKTEIEGRNSIYQIRLSN